MKKKLLAGLALSLLPVSASLAAVSYDGTTYSQNFDGLANSGTGNAWAQDSTLPGWSLFTGAGANIPTYNAGDGSSVTGSFYSFGTGTATDRAFGGTASGGAYFGSPASGAVAGYIAVSLLNTSGGTLDSLTLSYDGEQWRNGGNASQAAQSMVLQYGFGATFGAVSTWNTPGGTFDWTSPVTTATAGAVDGNGAGLVAGRGGSLSSLGWNNGDTLWLRWIENNDVGNDHGLAIDNFSATSVPEPSSLALGILGGLAGLFVWKRRK